MSVEKQPSGLLLQPGLGDPSKISGNLFLTHDCPTFVGQESATAGGRDSAHLHCVRRPNNARSLATAAVSPLPRVFGNAPCSRAPAPPNGNAFGGIRGARGELFPPAGSGAEPRVLLPGLPSTQSRGSAPLLWPVLLPL